jgi:hypothetical protein
MDAVAHPRRRIGCCTVAVFGRSDLFFPFGLGWCLKRVGNHFDRRFQRLDPLITIPGMNVLPSVARQISFDILFDRRMTLGGERVAQIADRGMAMAVEGLVGVGDANDIAQPLGDWACRLTRPPTVRVE